MRRVLRLLFNRWTLTAVGLIAVALVIWWVGPTIAILNVYPLEPEWARSLLIGLVVAIPIVRLAW